MEKLERNSSCSRPFQRTSHDPTGCIEISGDFICREAPKIGFQIRALVKNVEDADQDDPSVKIGMFGLNRISFTKIVASHK